MTSYFGQTCGRGMFYDANGPTQSGNGASGWVPTIVVDILAISRPGPFSINFGRDYDHLPLGLDLEHTASTESTQANVRDYYPQANNIDGAFTQDSNAQFNLAEEISQWHINDYFMGDLTSSDNSQNLQDLNFGTQIHFIHQSIQDAQMTALSKSSDYSNMLQNFLMPDLDHQHWSTPAPGHIVHNTIPLGFFTNDQGAYIDQTHEVQDMQETQAPQVVQHAQALTHKSNPFLCTKPGCSVTFKRNSDRVRHEVAIHGINQAFHLCPLHDCVKSRGSGYSRKDKLTEHMWKKHANLGFAKGV